MQGSLLLTCLLLSGVFAGAAPADGQIGRPTGNLLLDLGRDALALPTWTNATWALGGAAATWGAYEIEDPIGARHALDRGIIDPLADSGNIYGDLRFQAPLALAAWGVGRWRDQDEARDLGYDLIRALSLNYALTGAMKPVVDRSRPNGEDYSFPSGHTSAAFATAGVVSRRLGRGWTAAALSAGLLTALGRMEDEKHFASDVTAGAAIGWIIGRNAARGASSSAAEPNAGAWRIAPAAGGAVLSRRF